MTQKQEYGKEKKSSALAPLNLPGNMHRDMTWLHRRLMGTLLLSQADIDTLNALRPRCARCKKLVEEFSWVRDSKDRNLTFYVLCHGAKLDMRVTFEDIPGIMLAGVAGGEVFGDVPLIGETRKIEGE